MLFVCCNQPVKLPTVNSENGGLFLPKNFEAVVVVDSLGSTRHITVNDNGDIYVQLQNSIDGKGAIGLRDTDGDHKVDSNPLMVWKEKSKSMVGCTMM